MVLVMVRHLEVADLESALLLLLCLQALRRLPVEEFVASEESQIVAIRSSCSFLDPSDLSADGWQPVPSVLLLILSQEPVEIVPTSP